MSIAHWRELIFLQNLDAIVIAVATSTHYKDAIGDGSKE
jgi:hypothetical protein